MRHIGFSTSNALFSLELKGCRLTSVQIRDAQVSDIPLLAYVCLQATGGIFEALYQGSIPGRETSHIVEHLFSRLNATSSYRNCQIFEAKGAAVGGLHGYPFDASTQDPGDPLARADRFHLVRPFMELPPPSGSYYVSSVGFYSNQRGRGYGRQLMQEAEAIARTKALNSMSLHVFERNSPAVTLYKSMGYEALGRQAVVTHPLIRYDGQLLLMGKSLD